MTSICVDCDTRNVHNTGPVRAGCCGRTPNAKSHIQMKSFLFTLCLLELEGGLVLGFG